MKVVLVGLGFMGRAHLEAISGLPGVELAGIVDPDEGKLALGVERYEDLDAALKDPSVDAVDLCLPTDLHEAASIDALKRGKHVLVEKPMALSEAACSRMIETAREADRVTIGTDGALHLSAIEALPTDGIPKRTRDLIFREIGTAQFADMIMEMDAHTGFSEVLRLRKARDANELVSLYAALIAHGTELDAKSVAAMIPQLDPAHISTAMRFLEMPGRLPRAKRPAHKRGAVTNPGSLSRSMPAVRYPRVL